MKIVNFLSCCLGPERALNLLRDLLSFARRQTGEGYKYLSPSPASEAKWERLSDLSRLICKFQSCFSGFGIESDEKFMGESDTDDHFWFSLIDEALAKRGE